MDVLAEIRHHVVAELDGARQAENKVREVKSRGIAYRGSERLAELSGVSVLSVKRVDVEHFCADDREFVAGLEGVPAFDPGVAEFRVKRCWILKLRIRSLAAEQGEAADRLRIETAGEVG